MALVPDECPAMEFRIDLNGASPDATRLASQLADLDPSATGALDPERGLWRVNTVLRAGDLVALLADAGCPIAPQQVTLLPSTCCGGCSG
jgi:hypothetical protein